ncbi:MAG: ATP-binding cassette domain-containing protein [Kiritimatiellales bacterium]|nr:ATP-binding cassette domain-containing protein [Kiritimatiellales bacterium]
MIIYDNISIRIHRQELFKKVSIHLAAGDKFVLCGASGSGKSSLLKCTVGALPISEGSIHVAGMELSASTVSEIRARVAFIGQEPVLGAATVREAVLLPFSFKTHRHHSPDEARIQELAGRLHLPMDILAKPCARISGGEKQRIALLRALLLDKTIFLADEVTSALDPESKQAVMAELFRPEITLLSVSHDPEWVGACNHIVEVADGQLKEKTG